MSEEQTLSSPLPEVEAAEKDSGELTFPLAIQAVVNGQRIARNEWEDKTSFGCMNKANDGNTYLMIYREGTFYTWIVTDADMVAEDWYILPTRN